MLIKIAWRNIWRHKTRSLVIIISVIFGLWSGLFIQAYMNGMIEERLRTAIEKEISHIQIHNPLFKKDYDLKYVIDDGNKMLGDIKKYPSVRSAAGRIVSKGMIGAATGSSGIKINGIDPVSEDSVTHLSKNIIDGKYFLTEVKNEILIGEKLLNKLKLKLNSKVVITLMDKDNNITSGAFRIKGVYKTRNAPYDESNIFADINDISVLTATKYDINEIAILLKSAESLDTIYKKLQTDYPLAKTEDWKEVAPEIHLLVSTSNQSLFIYMGIILLALAFGIINTMLMAVLERTREIGMLMALGMNKLKVFNMILLETVFLVMTGTPVGILLGMITVAYFGRYGIDMSIYKELFASFGYSEIIFPKLNSRDYTTILELVIITSVISSFFPARKALTLNPSESIRK